MGDVIEDEGRTQYKVIVGEPRQSIERYERLDQEKKDIADARKR